MIELRILGALDLRPAGGKSLDEALRRSKRTALLAYLAAARPFGFHRRDKLVALFWPELDKERARGALRTTLARLRDDLGDDVVESRGAEEIGIRRDVLWCDAVALQECLDRKNALGAADLYRGPMLDGVHVPGTSLEFEQWLSAERDTIRRALLTVLASAAETEASRGAFGEAIAYSRRACELAPEDELAARRLIRITLAGGDRGAALRAYDALEAVLRRDFNVAPSAETIALIAPLRAGAAGEQRGSAPRHAAVAPPTAMRKGRDPATTLAWSAAAAGVFLAAALGIRQVTAASAPPARSPWQPLKSVQAQFRGRIGSAAFMDSAGGLVVIGGMIPRDAGQPNDVRDEIWRISSVRAEDVAGFARVNPRPGPGPTARWIASVAYDAAHDRAILHGGALGTTSPCVSDSWVLDNASGRAAVPGWRTVAVRGETPPPHAGAAAVFDSVARRLILFGGHDCFSTFFNDVWRLDFDDASLSSGTWSRLSVNEAAGGPARRNTMAVWYDATGDRLFVFGGTAGSSASNDLWVLEGTREPGPHGRWRALRCAGEAPRRSVHAAAYDAGSGSVLIFGGTDGDANYRREMFRLSGLQGNARDCRWDEVPVAEPWPQARSRPQLLFDRRTGLLVMFGGEYQNSTFSDVWTMPSAFTR